MIKLTKNAFLIVALLGGAIGFTSCNSTSTNTTANNTTANKTAVTNTAAEKTNTADSSAEKDKTETALKGDKIGVPECDEYIEKYEACINSKVPEAQRGMYKPSFETLRKSWKDAATTSQGKAGLAAGCKQALDTAKTSMASFSCNW